MMNSRYFWCHQANRVISTVTHYQMIFLGLPWCSGSGLKIVTVDRPSRQVTINTNPDLPIHRWVLAMGTPHGLWVFWQYRECFSPTPPTMHPTPPPPLPPLFTQWQVNAQMEQTSENKKSSAWSILGFRRTQSNLPPISRLAFDYVDD